LQLLLLLTSEGRRIKTPPWVDSRALFRPGPRVQGMELATEGAAGSAGGEGRGAKQAGQAFRIMQ